MRYSTPTGWWWFSLLLALCLAAPALGSPRKPEARLVAAELAIMEGDLALLDSPEVTGPQARGLMARLNGALSSLGLLVRQARAADDDRPPPVQAMREALAQRDFGTLKSLLAGLAAEFPLDSGAITAAAGEAARQRGQYIYEELCQGCHESTETETEAELPARDLFDQARTEPPRIFAARLIGGLRGTPATSLSNPFTDADLGALYAYLRSR